jgi:hypothetical protein
VSDQVDALDEQADKFIVKLMMDAVFLSKGSISFTQDETMALRKVARAKLSALLVEAREQGALAYAESLTASGKQADNHNEESAR